jgi:uncharacterized protein (DUF2225 family)
MTEGLYKVSLTCPICEENFDGIKVKSTVLRIDHSDEDFCMHYKGINPLFYDTFVCNHCGYADSVKSFGTLTAVEVERLEKLCLDKFTDDPKKDPFELTDFHKKVFSFFTKINHDGTRDMQHAISSFEILEDNLHARKAAPKYLASSSLRLAWLYRILKDDTELEYLKKAIDYYEEHYQTLGGSSKEGTESETCAYLIGELNRRINNFDKALLWFGRLISMPKRPETAKIVEKAREQKELIKSAESLNSMAKKSD